jgi:hypothetical protein
VAPAKSDNILPSLKILIKRTESRQSFKSDNVCLSRKSSDHLQHESPRSTSISNDTISNIRNTFHLVLILNCTRHGITHLRQSLGRSHKLLKKVGSSPWGSLKNYSKRQGPALGVQRPIKYLRPSVLGSMCSMYSLFVCTFGSSGVEFVICCNCYISGVEFVFVLHKLFTHPNKPYMYVCGQQEINTTMPYELLTLP